MTDQPFAVTALLGRIEAGDDTAREDLLEVIYDELRSLARGLLRRNPGNATLQPTLLAHDAFLRLLGPNADPSYTGRKHFFAVAARAMRQLVTDHARRHMRVKRGGGQEWQRVTLSDAVAPPGIRETNVIALDDALSKLQDLDSTQAQIVEFRFFTGLSIEETAEALEVSETKVKDLWRGARAWLKRELSA